jgi:hypothetical protein
MSLGDFYDMDDHYQVHNYEAGAAFLEALSAIATV